MYILVCFKEYEPENQDKKLYKQRKYEKFP